MLKRSIAPLVAALVLTGCTGKVIMEPLDPATISSNYAKKTATEGIIVYRAIQLVQVDKFTQISVPVDPKKPDGPSQLSGACKPVFTRKVVSVPDTEHPYRLYYDHGILEGYTFGATLTADGILTVINTVSAPDQGKTFQNLAAAAASAAGILVVVPGPPDCTQTPVFEGYERPPVGPAIRDFGGHK